MDSIRVVQNRNQKRAAAGTLTNYLCRLKPGAVDLLWIQNRLKTTVVVWSGVLRQLHTVVLISP